MTDPRRHTYPPPPDVEPVEPASNPDWYGTALLCLLSFIVAAALITILVMLVVS